MSPRDLHFPPQHMRQFRPPLSPSTSPEYRIYDLNKRLSMRTEDNDSFWWDSFVNEFFEDDASLSISMCLEDGPKRFNIGRVLIPRFFRTLFEGGVSEVYFLLKHAKEIFHNAIISLDCEQGSLITCFGKPSFVKICTEGHFSIDFTFDDLMRIKSWNFTIKQHRELIPRSVVAIPTDNPIYLDQLSKNFTRNGLTSSMLNFLRLCEILEPMQELMSRHKTTTFSPRDCLKTILHQRWSKTCSVDNRQTAKPRRKRKTTAGNNAALTPNKDSTTTTCTTPTKKRSPSNNANQQSSMQPINNMPGDVMIVGEPSLMGGEMDDEDERYITRLENTQYDPNTTSSQYHSPIHSNSQTYQQNPNLQSLLHPKQQFMTNSSILNPNQIKREQVSYPGSPQQQQQQQLPSMFSNNQPSVQGMTTLNGELSMTGKRISSANNNNSPQTPSANTQNQNCSTSTSAGNNSSISSVNTSWNGTAVNANNYSSSANNQVINEKKQEPHTPPVASQPTIVTAS